MVEIQSRDSGDCVSHQLKMGIMKLTLASKSVVDWQYLSQVIDSDKLDKGPGIKGYLTVMNDMEINARRHIFYSFYCELDEKCFFAIASLTELSVTINNDYCGLVSASIENWEKAFLTFCQSKYQRELRLFFNTIMSYMETDGVRFDHPKLELRDRTFTLGRQSI